MKRVLEVFRALGGRGILVNVLAVVAAGLAATGHIGTGAILAVVVAALGLYFTRVLNPFSQRNRERLAARSTSTSLGSYAVSRTVVALVVLLLQLDEGHGGVPVLALGLGLAVAVILEPLVARALTGWASYAAHTPWAEIRQRARVGGVVLFLANTWFLIAALVASMLGALPLDLLALPVVSLVISTFLIIEARRQVHRRRRFELELPERLTEYAPRFVLYWEAGPRTSYQITMWLPYLDRIGERYVIVLRNAANFTEVCEAATVPVLVRRSMTDLDAVVVPSLRVAFYVNNSIRNPHFVRFPQLNHIQLNHGDSDKAPSFNPVMRMYDKDFVAGQAAVDRFAAHGVAVHDDLFTIVGRPQVEGVLVRRREGDLGGTRAVLYAPTWAGFMADSDYSSLRVGPQIVAALLARGCSVIFRPHPHSRRSPELAAACDEIVALLAADEGDRRHLYGEVAEQQMSIFDCFNASDAMVSDVSSVVPDYLFSAKPFALVAVNATPEEFLAANPIAVGSYVVHEDLGNLPTVLDDLLERDPLEARRSELKAYYLGDFPDDGYADAFVDAARRYVLAPVEHADGAAAAAMVDEPEPASADVDAGE